jgi:hypothetical protein
VPSGNPRQSRNSRIHEARGANANPEDRAVCRGDHLVHKPHGESQCVVTVGVLGRDLDTVEDLAAKADRCRREDPIAQVDSYQQPCGIRNLEQDRGLASR